MSPGRANGAAILASTSYGSAEKSGPDGGGGVGGVLGPGLKNERWVLAGFVEVEESWGFLKKGRDAKWWGASELHGHVLCFMIMGGGGGGEVAVAVAVASRHVRRDVVQKCCACEE